jgi:uncharacterized membrane protein
MSHIVALLGAPPHTKKARSAQAGKDVYSEKALSHSTHEGRMMVKAARKNNRVTATGSQQRKVSAALVARFFRPKSVETGAPRRSLMCA